MKLYTYDGQTFKSLPDPFQNMSPVTEELFEQLGGVITDDGTPTQEQEFEAACAYFRTICAAIGQFIGDEDFHGGLDEIPLFDQSEAVANNPVQALMLSQRLSWANEQCIMRGAKIGLGQPAWWYRCWELAGLDLRNA